MMKKIICLSLVLFALLSCLTACNFTQNMSGALAGEADATPKAEEMIEALADGNTAAAKALLHPQAAETSDGAIAQMSSFLAGRYATAIEVNSITVNTSTGTAGNTRQERVVYRVTLTDGDIIFLNVAYLSNGQGTGFASFQIVLGVV